jgi:hypothetical protein
MNSKPIVLSKTVIVSLIALVAMILQGIYGWQVLDASTQGAIYALVVIVLRIFTSKGVRLPAWVRRIFPGGVQFLPESEPGQKESPEGPPVPGP